MANKILLELLADANPLIKGLNVAQKSVESFLKGTTAAGGTASRALSDLGKSFGTNVFNVGKSLTILTAPLAGLGVLATKTAVEFETSFAGVRKTIDATEEEFVALERAFRETAKQIPVSVNELNRIGEVAGQLGIAKDSVLDFTKTVAAMSAATNLSSEDAANSFARIGSIMGVTAKDYQRLGSTIVDLGNKGASTEKDIVSMGLRISGAASAVGISTPAMLGLAASLANVGIEAEAGGTAMSKLIIQVAGAVSKGGKELSNFASISGLSASAFATAFREDGANAISLFIQGLGKVKSSGGDLIATLDQMGFSEVRLRDAILRAASSSDQFTQTLVTARSAWSENTALTTEAEKRYKTIASQLTVFQNKLSDTQLTIGQALIPMLTQLLVSLDPLIGMLASAATAFTQLDPGMQMAIAGTVAFVAVLGPVLILVGTMVTSISALIPVIASLGGALVGIPALLAAVGGGFTALSAVLLANPWILVVAAIVAAAIAIAANWDKIKSIATAAWTAIKESVVVKGAKAIYEGIVLWLIDKSSAVAGKLQGVAESFAKPFEWLANHLVGRSVIPDMIEDIQRNVQTLDIAMTAPARHATIETAKAFEGMALTAQGATNQILSTVNFGWGSAAQSVGSSLAQMTTDTVNWAEVSTKMGQQFLGNMITVFIQLLTQWVLTTTGITAAVVTGEAAKTATVAAGSATRLGIVSTTAASEAAINVAKNSAIIAGEAATSAGTIAIMGGTTAASLGFFGTITAGFSAMFASLVGVMAAVGTFVMGVLAAIASALSATIFGIPFAGAILVGIALIAAALYATGNLGFKEGGIGDFGSGTQATLHGQEAIIPLNSRGAAFMQDVMGGGSGGHMTVVMQLDGREIARNTLEHIPGIFYMKTGMA